MRHITKLGAGAAVAAALFTGTPLLSADAVPVFGRGKLPFSSTTSAPSEYLALTDDGAPRPGLCNPDNGRCQFGFVGYDRYEGAVSGDSVNVGSISIDLATFQGHANSLATFTGTVIGCPGAGTVLLAWESDLGVEPGRNDSTFRVVAGSGTGGLSGIRGRGSIVANITDPTGPISGAGTANLHCRA